MKESYGTLSETVNGLKEAGYTRDFNLHEECLVCRETNTSFAPEDFQIDKVFRFEGASNPDDESIVYAISSSKYAVKGSLVNGYGISADLDTYQLVEKLQIKTNQNIMENKSNDSTPQRPEGERILDGDLVHMDLNQFINKIKKESTWAESDRNSMTIFKSDTMRIVLLGLHENAELKTHQANGVISVQVLEGKIEFKTAHKTLLLEKNQMIALHENIPHSVKAVRESFFLLTLTMNKNSRV